MSISSIRPLLYLTLAVAGCSEYAIVSKDAPPDPLAAEECAELCNAAPSETALGCDVDCRVDAGRDHHGEVGAVILSMSYDSQGAVSCDLVVTCPDPTECQLLYQTCLADSTDAESCAWIAEMCLLVDVCQPTLDQCYINADQWRDECEARGDDDCQLTWHADRHTCDCSFDDCTNVESPECAATAQALIAPPPQQTGPSRWRVSRRAIDAEVGRLNRLQAQTLAWPSANGARTQWRGVRLGRVDAGTALHAVGLRSNDLLRRVNGLSVTAVFRDVSTLNQLRQASTLLLEIERQGTARTLRYDLVP